MAGSAPEGSQFDARQYDAKMTEIVDGGEEFFTSYDEVNDGFDAMRLRENLLRAIYTYVLRIPRPFSKEELFQSAKDSMLLSSRLSLELENLGLCRKPI
ncbi:Eukaryotic initiation factor 4A-I [Castilleja foliolosa]|uniref:Eukaryotic initiation factor 4A-I n=1 Tax=Castilleja foliolosa TaxID=1961234 RepID=A0ABD3B7S6_9LAMI